jgi:hypothetical protein
MHKSRLNTVIQKFSFVISWINLNAIITTPSVSDSNADNADARSDRSSSSSNNNNNGSAILLPVYAFQ